MQYRSKTHIKKANNVVSISALSSAEHIAREGAEPQRVLSSISLRIDREQAWGITARTGYEVRLLLEIIGGIRPYDGGKCVLIERGMMRHKRVIQPHVFYIGGTETLYGNMNVLEYLMFATARIRKDRLSMQEELLGFLTDAGLGDISLTLIKLLDPEEKAIVELIAAAYSGSAMIIFNLPEAKFDERLQGAIAGTAKLVVKSGKSLIIGTKDCHLIQKACSHTAFIADGSIIYQGTTDSLRQEYDKVAVIIDDPDIAGIKQKIVPALAGCSLIERDGRLLVKADADGFGPRQIYQAIIESGTEPCSVTVNEKNVSNAYEELIRRNDLSEQLF
jgi:ABC-2 type transport system ATP-binding protein